MTNPIKVTPGQARRLQRNVERAGEGKAKRKEVETVHVEAFMMIIKAYVSCGEDPKIPHVWLSSKIPPDDDDRCMCGKSTWKADVDRRRREFAEVKR